MPVQQAMKRPLFQALANKVQAIKNCRTAGNTEWEGKHTATIERLVEEHLPSGSGFDSGTHLCLDHSQAEKLIFTTSFHHMNEHGFYDGWTEHEVIVGPSLPHGFCLEIRGEDRDDIHNYIGDVFHEALTKEIDDQSDIVLVKVNPTTGGSA